MLPRGPPQRPIHKQTHRTQEKRLTHSTSPHLVQHTYTMHCATARCVSAVSLKHARHAHAQVTRETHHTWCTQAAFLKSSTSPTVLPGAPLREVVSLKGGSCASAWTSAAPHPQTNTQDTREALDPQHSTTSCAAYVHYALCNRTMCLIHSYIRTFVHSYIHTFIHSYIHTFIHSYIHTFTHPYIHTFIHSYSAEQAERRIAEHSERHACSLDPHVCTAATWVNFW